MGHLLCYWLIVELLHTNSPVILRKSSVALAQSSLLIFLILHQTTLSIPALHVVALLIAIVLWLTVDVVRSAAAATAAA